jgi:glycine oxidase
MPGASSIDCLVIGGGIVGLTVARRLGRDGLRVTLLEKGRCGGEASWAGAGILSPCNPHRTDFVHHLHEHSLDLYPAFCAELFEETGVDPEYERCGELELLFTDDAYRIARADERAAAGRTMPDGAPVYELHEGDAARQIEPLISGDILGALECRRTGVVRNPRLLRAVRTACEIAGVTIREDTPAADLLFDGERVTGVITGEGAVRAGHVVLCAGAWSSQISERLGSIMPVHPVRGQMILLKLPERRFQRAIMRGRNYLVPRRDGYVLLGSTEEPEAGYSKRNTAKAIAMLMEKGMQLVPSLAEASVEATWAGLRPGTPDDKPYIGPVPGITGLIAATGHFRSGLTLAPVTAEVVSGLVQTGQSSFDLSLCRPGRLTRKASNQTIT